MLPKTSIPALREFSEELERQILSPYATLSAESRGRIHPEEKCVVRTEFQRDRDRILYSKAFRRLKHKTQVFIAPEGDHYRTRLTHTLEVAQIARTVARGLRLNEDLAEAISLGHDLGHPPFGHAGETALDRVLREFSPKSHFRHNEQSLRVVDILEGEMGLNLTFEVRDGILRHAKGRSDLLKIPGCQDTDKPCTLEGQAVRIADRLAYINHDIDDAIRAKLIDEKDLPARAVAILGSTTSERINSMVLDVVSVSTGENTVKMSAEVGELTDLLKEFMFENVYVGSRAKKEEDKAKDLVTRLFYHFMEDPEKLPRNNIQEGLDLTRMEDRARAVCDYIAGMTDRYTLMLFDEIFVPKVWMMQ